MTDWQAEFRDAIKDRYQLLLEIGRGGMAAVFLSKDLRHNRNVAVKVVLPDRASTLAADRFMREIDLAAKLSHPHIVPLLDSGQAGDFLYYVMPYIEGESLRERLHREGQLPVEDTVQIVREVTAASQAEAEELTRRHSLEADAGEEAFALRASFAPVGRLRAGGANTLLARRTGRASGAAGPKNARPAHNAAIQDAMVDRLR